MRQINRYYTREGSVSVKISNYGNRNAMTESRSLPSAKILSGCGKFLTFPSPISRGSFESKWRYSDFEIFE
jgi:hypothetical protein